jgi:hypothetical protein
MGLAFAELHWSPSTFWSSTVRELMSGYARLIPNDPINKGTHKPFTSEEKAVLAEIKKKVERERELKNGR